MSDAAVRPLRPERGAGAAAVAARVLAEIDGLVERLGVAYGEVPEYAAMESTVLSAEVLPTSRRICEGFFVPLAEGREPDPSHLLELPAMGRRRQEMGIPLEPMLHVYRVCGRVVWDAVVAAVGEGEHHLLAGIGARWMDYIDRAASVAAAAYLAASHERLRHVDERRRAILEALLSARSPAEVAAVSIEHSISLAPAYAPVVVAGPQAGGRIDALLAAAPAGTIGGHRAGRVLLLVPAPLGDVGAIARAAGRALVCWSDPAPAGATLLVEVGHAERLLCAAQAAGEASGAFGPDDLLVEQLLEADARVAAAIRRRVLGALAGRDHDGLVTSTLASYLATGSVTETAKREVVHPNTVLYRLGRVKALTGLDPRLPAEAATLVLALRANGAQASPPGAPA